MFGACPKRKKIVKIQGNLKVEKETIFDLVRRFSESVRKAFDPEMIILYGSYAKGTQSESSDIDVAVIVDRVEGDFLDQETLLYRMRRDIDDRIEPILIESTSDRSGFLHSIMSTGEIVYKR